MTIEQLREEIHRVHPHLPDDFSIINTFVFNYRIPMEWLDCLQENNYPYNYSIAPIMFGGYSDEYLKIGETATLTIGMPFEPVVITA